MTITRTDKNGVSQTLHNPSEHITRQQVLEATTTSVQDLYTRETKRTQPRYCLIRQDANFDIFYTKFLKAEPDAIRDAQLKVTHTFFESKQIYPKK